MNNIKYVGMDVHKSIIVIVVLNELGQVESRSQVKTKAENICDFFRGISGKVEVVFEEGTHSAWLYKLLKPLVASVTVCDPRHNKLIEDGNKSTYENDSYNFLHFSNLNIFLGAESKINSLCVFQSPRIGNLIIYRRLLPIHIEPIFAEPVQMPRHIWAESADRFGIYDCIPSLLILCSARVIAADVIEDQAIGHQMIVLDQFSLLVAIILLQRLPAERHPL